MKKTILILLSLILLFCFVSCNGSTNSPSDSGSTNNPSDSGSSTKPSINLPTAPVDTNVPPESAFKNAEETDGNINILTGLNELEGNQELVGKVEEKSTITYQIKSGVLWDGKYTDSGILTVKQDYKYENAYNFVYTFNGEIIIDGVKYTFENFVYSCHEGQDPEVTITGIVKIDGSPIDNTEIDEYNIINDIINDIIFGNYITSISTIQSAIVEGGRYLEFASPIAKGKFSASRSATSNSIINEAVAYFDRVLIEGVKHTLTASYKVIEPFDGEPTIDISYISFDNEYYQPSTIAVEIIEKLVFWAASK